MDFEVEFHPVGDASRAGDAITVRYWDGTRFRIIVVDGGTDDTGDILVEHITRHYGASIAIDHVISTHPDTDHACGLRAVLKEFSVGTLWVHGVWHHADEMLPYFLDKRWTAAGLSAAIRERYSVVEELIKLASDQGTAVREPFAGEQIGPFTVLSPYRWSYLRLVPQFRKTPEPDADALAADTMLIKSNSTPSWLAKALQAVASWVGETWDLELLREHPTTAAENESSTVLLGQFGTQTLLLTGDAGVNGLHWALGYADEHGLSIQTPTIIQVPHHGSRSNVSPSILNRLLGSPQMQGESPRGTAVVSVPKDDASHPRKMVVNAFRRRGYPVNKTQGVYYRRFTPGMPDRDGEVPAVAFDWFDQVEDYD